MVTLQEYLDSEYKTEKEKEEVEVIDEWNKLTKEGSLDLRDYVNLRHLCLFGNRLTDINLTENKNLQTLNLQRNQLINIDLTKNLNLRSLNISHNQLTSIDLKENKNLTTLKLDYNQLTSIDLSKNINLQNLHLDGNQLTNIDLTNNNDNLQNLHLHYNKLTTTDFLRTIPYPEKLEKLYLYNNNIQPTDISVFRKFVNLEVLKIGTTNTYLGSGHNKFYGSFQSWKDLKSLENICIEATDVENGLEYLPSSLANSTAKRAKEERNGGYFYIECSPHNANAKCKAIQDQLRPFNYDLEAWQLTHPHLMYKARPELFEQPESREKWLNAVAVKINKTQTKLQETKQNEPDKIKRIKRLESKIRELELVRQLIVEKGFHTEREMVDKARIKELEKENSELKEQVQSLTQKLEQIHLISQIEVPPK